MPHYRAFSRATRGLVSASRDQPSSIGSLRVHLYSSTQSGRREKEARRGDHGTVSSCRSDARGRYSPRGFLGRWKSAEPLVVRTRSSTRGACPVQVPASLSLQRTATTVDPTQDCASRKMLGTKDRLPSRDCKSSPRECSSTRWAFVVQVPRSLSLPRTAPTVDPARRCASRKMFFTRFK